MAQLTIKNPFANLFNFGLTEIMLDMPANRLTITEQQVYTLPRDVTSIRVLSGTAWISHLGQDIVLYSGQTLELQSARDIAVVTSTGRKPVELELTQ